MATGAPLPGTHAARPHVTVTPFPHTLSRWLDLACSEAGAAWPPDRRQVAWVGAVERRRGLQEPRARAASWPRGHEARAFSVRSPPAPTPRGLGRASWGTSLSPAPRFLPLFCAACRQAGTVSVLDPAAGARGLSPRPCVCGSGARASGMARGPRFSLETGRATPGASVRSHAALHGLLPPSGRPRQRQ